MSPLQKRPSAGADTFTRKELAASQDLGARGLEPRPLHVEHELPSEGSPELMAYRAEVLRQRRERA
jgi:hypothetical protein